MFKIKSLSLFKDKESYKYNFTSGLNYIVGGNSTGKTVFYDFLGYMFGASDDLSQREWFKDSLDEAIMSFEYNNISYDVKRTLDTNECYIKYAKEFWAVQISLEEYKKRLNSIFSTDHENLKQFRIFSQENISFRTMTMFNFLGEKRQGELINFLDKAKDVKYYVKLKKVLNYIFNNNLELILKKQEELEQLQVEINNLQRGVNNFNYLKSKIDSNLSKLGSSLVYSGKNKDEILKEIDYAKKLNRIEQKKKKNNPSLNQLYVYLNNIDEQLKIHEQNNEDIKVMERENRNREEMILSLEEAISNHEEYEYLVNPIKQVLENLNHNIAFSNYLQDEEIVTKMKAERKIIEDKIKTTKDKYEAFTIEDKVKSINLVEELLQDSIINEEETLKKKKRIRTRLKREIQDLQNEEDKSLINSISEDITSLYFSAKDISKWVESDSKLDEFRIKYMKRENALQPQVIVNEKYKDYSVGSMARHTLIQLCGYLAFLKVLIQDDKYPIIPILLIDHVSKPFDDDNMQALGAIMEKFYEDVNEQSFQVIMFDDKEPSSLKIKSNNVIQIVEENKTGFNPFYFKNQE